MFYIDKFKNYAKKVNRIDHDNKELKKRVRELEKTVDSYNNLFNNLYVYHDFKKTKLLEQSNEIILLMMDFIDNVCKKYGLEWSLCGGCVLGAVRHGGFIPWDDDCDIIMLRKDYNRLLEVIDDEIEKYGLENRLRVKLNKKVKSKNVPFTKLDFWHGRDLIGFVDIFPIDFTTNIENIKERYEEEFVRFRKDLNNGMPLEDDLKISFEKLDITLERTEHLITCIETGISSNIKPFRLFETDKMYPLSTIQFEDRIYPCFKDPIHYLEIKYGKDYMTIPKKIMIHGLHHRLLTTDNVHEILEENIELLKNVNENFEF